MASELIATFSITSQGFTGHVDVQRDNDILFYKWF